MLKTPEPSLNPALREFWTTKARHKVLYGGRTSSKSWDAAGFAIFLANSYKLKFLCTRQIQNRIDESVYALLKIQIERFNLGNRFRIYENKIVNIGTGSEFLFYGLWRHVREIKSLEGIDVLWCEESEALTEAQWEILEPTIRKEGSECWFLFNPNMVTDFVYQHFVTNPPPSTIVRKINYDENPFLSQTILDVIQAKKERDFEGYQHIYLGVPRQDDESTIIRYSWIEAAIDSHIKLGFEPEGVKRVGFDVADDGGDTNAFVYAHGSVALHLEEWLGGEDEILKSCMKVYNFAVKNEAEIDYDSIGVGASAGSKFLELNEEKYLNVKYHKFNAGSSVLQPEKEYQQNVKNKDHFSNLKAQAWGCVADRFRNTYNAIHNGENFSPDELISISSNLPNLTKLKSELSTPKRDFDNNGRLKVESKKDLAKRGIKSPNLADAFIMAYAPRDNSGVSWFDLDISI